jgi:4-hydroxy-tetrahydrodipicolinate synthase
MSLFKGSGVALITPFKHDVIDDLLFTSLIEFHIKHNTDALIIGGTTGESATLSKEEKLHIYKLAVETSNKRIPIIANTGTYNTKESIELSIKAEQLGVDGLLLVTPYYNKPTQRGLYAHFKAIADAVSIPVILYNVPGRTSVNLEAKTTILLSKIPNIVAIKEASGNLTQVKTIIEGVTKDFDVYTGNDDLIYDVLKLGGKGVISVVANILPFETHNLCKQFETNEQKALEIQKHLDIFNDVLYIESNPVPVKTVFKLLGIDVGSPRLPLVDMEDSNIVILKEAMKKANLKEISL